MKPTLSVLVALLPSVWLASALPVPAEVDLKPLAEKLGSDSTQDRIQAIRDLMRLKPTAAAARPLLEKALTDPEPLVRGDLVWAVHEILAEKGSDLLEKLYGDPDRLVRDNALRAACKLWDKTDTRNLCRAGSEDPDYGARIEVINTLRENFGQDPAAVEIFRKGLKDPSELVQRAAVFGVQTARDAKSVADLAQLARTGQDLVAVPACADALATIGTPEAVRELSSLLAAPKGEPGKPAPKRPSEVVRNSAARALARIKDPSSLPALRAVMTDPSVTVRLGAMEALLAMEDKDSVPLVVAELDDPEARVRRFALRVLNRVADGDTKVGDRTVADAVRKLLREDKEITVRQSAAPTLASLLKERSIPDLVALKTDLDPRMRLEAVGALAGIGKPAAEALSGFIGDADTMVRALAIEGVGQIGSEKQVPALAAAAEDSSKKNKQVRVAVASALGAIGHASGVPTLLKLAKDADPAVRQAAAGGLGHVGGQEAKEALAVLAKDDVAFVRTAARKAQEQSAGRSR